MVRRLVEQEQVGIGTERAAEALFNVSCASCHGRDGRGQGERRPPGAAVPDFTQAAFQAQRSDAQLGEVIRTGRGLMPAFGKQNILTAEQIDAGAAGAPAGVTIEADLIVDVGGPLPVATREAA